MPDIEKQFEEIKQETAEQSLSEQTMAYLNELGRGDRSKMETDAEFDHLVADYFIRGDQEGMKAFIRKREKWLHELARLDSLTGLKNRRAFDERIQVLFDQVQDTGEPKPHERRQELDLSIIFVDLDHFKQLNDTYGHVAGDEALKAITHALRKATRPTDLVCRYGGEEFVIAFLGLEASARVPASERVRRAIEEAEFIWEGERVPLTASVGAAKYQKGETLPHLLGRADHAMYWAKTHGRNQTAVAELLQDETSVNG